MKKLYNFSLTAGFVIAVAGGLAGSAQADSITSLFNTGVDASGTPLGDGTIGDPHYTLVSVPAPSTTVVRVRTSAGGYPIPPYIGDDSVSAWIGPNNDNALDSPVGNYDFKTTFDLTGYDAASMAITGQWAADNQGTDILVNGVSTSNTTTNGFGSFTSFSLSSGFVAGINTLDFIEYNAGGPTALRVEMSGTANLLAVPEPASFGMLSLALVGLAACGRKRAKPF